MRNKVWHVVAALLVMLSVQGPSSYAQEISYAGMPKKCQAFVQDLRSGKIDPQNEIEHTYPGVSKTFGGIIGTAGVLGMANVYVLGAGSAGSFAAALAGGALMPFVGAVAVAAVGGYLIYRGIQGSDKVECMQIAQALQVNFSVSNNRNPGVNDSRQVKRAHSETPQYQAPKEKTGHAPAM